MSFDIVNTTQRILKKNWDIRVFKSINSTSTYAKENLDKLNLPTLILAEHQTHGRGRGQHDWQDDNHGKQFLGTFVFAVNSSQSGKPLIDPKWTLALGLFVFESLKSVWPDLDFSIKAPNDIFLGNKKLAGILVETNTLNQTPIMFFGLGLNIFDAPQNYKEIATHLPQVDEASWKLFLTKLSQSLENFDSFIASSQWLANISASLIKALNLNPHHKTNPIQEVLENGTLKLEQGFLHWLEL